MTSRPSGSPSSPSHPWIGRTRSGTIAIASQAEPDDEQSSRGDATAGPAPAQPPDRDEDDEDREDDADEAQQADGHVPSV